MVALLREDRQVPTPAAKKHRSEESVRLGALMNEAGKIRKQLENREISRDEAYQLLDELRTSGRSSFFHRAIWKGR